MSAKRVAVYLYDWQIERLKEMNENPYDIVHIGGLPLSHFIRNLISEVIEKGAKAK